MRYPINPHGDGSEPDRSTALAQRQVVSGAEAIPAELAETIFRHMVRTRVLEERSIKMSKSGEAYFWIGGPGEEAFNVCLGMQVHRGQGPAFDYLHLHYRNAGLMLALGMSPADHLRQLAMRATDPHSRGRNFVGHYAVPAWNVLPVTSVIEVQYLMAPGTALMQKRQGGQGVSLVVGGDAGTAEGDFASCMIWSTRPGQELPVLMLITNNAYGISTPADEQHAEEQIIDRGKAFGIPGELVDGNDPVATWRCLERGLAYCRSQRRPYMIEAKVARLHGHSSSSGARRIEHEVDCVQQFEEQLIEAGLLHRELAEVIHAEATAEIEAAVEQVMSEAEPRPEDVERFTYAASQVDAIYPEDYTGLPGAVDDSLRL